MLEKAIPSQSESGVPEGVTSTGAVGIQITAGFVSARAEVDTDRVATKDAIPSEDQRYIREFIVHGSTNGDGTRGHRPPSRHSKSTQPP
jgi:hypothetical protein